MAFRLLVDDARRWKNSMDAIVNLIDEGQLEIGAEGLLLRAMDPSQIAMISFSMPKAAFVEYEVSSGSKIGLNFDSLSKILARTRGKEQLEISDEDNKLVLRFLEGKRKRSFKVPLMDLPPGVQKEPSIKHDVTIVVGSNQFKETLRDAALVSSHLTLEANEDGFNIDVHGDSADLKVESDKESEGIISIKAAAPARATFPLQYLEDIVKACPDDKPIHINLKSNAPVKIEYEIESAKCVYYLAPRIDTE